jgi:hypothetical protein
MGLDSTINSKLNDNFFGTGFWISIKLLLCHSLVRLSRYWAFCAMALRDSVILFINFAGDAMLQSLA